MVKRMHACKFCEPSMFPCERCDQLGHTVEDCRALKCTDCKKLIQNPWNDLQFNYSGIEDCILTHSCTLCGSLAHDEELCHIKSNAEPFCERCGCNGHYPSKCASYWCPGCKIMINSERNDKYENNRRSKKHTRLCKYCDPNCVYTFGCDNCGYGGHRALQCNALECQYCGDKIQSRNNCQEENQFLLKHCIRKHSCSICKSKTHAEENCNVLQCDVCKKMVQNNENSLAGNENNLQQHMKIHKPRILSCPFCKERRFHSEAAIQLHLDGNYCPARSNRDEAGRSYCKYQDCTRDFKKLSAAKQHYEDKHDSWY